MNNIEIMRTHNGIIILSFQAIVAVTNPAMHFFTAYTTADMNDNTQINTTVLKVYVMKKAIIGRRIVEE